MKREAERAFRAIPKITKTVPQLIRRKNVENDLFRLSFTLAIVDESHNYRTLTKDGVALMRLLHNSWGCHLLSGTPIYTSSIVSVVPTF